MKKGPKLRIAQTVFNAELHQHIAHLRADPLLTQSCVYVGAFPKPASTVLKGLYMCIILSYRAEARRVMC